MANRALIKYYAKLIQEDRMALEELLPSVRQDVENYLNGKGFQPRHTEEIPLSTEVYEEKMGAMHLPNLHLYMNKNVKGTRRPDGSLTLAGLLDLNRIFSRNTIGDMPTPMNTTCRVVYVENTGRIFNDPVTVNIHRVDDRDRTYYFEMTTPGMRKSTGYPMNIFRFDVMIGSDNYEDMRMTVYIRL